MTEPTVGLKLPMTDESAQRPLPRDGDGWGQVAERLGYDSVWVSEGWGADVFVTLTEMAYRTDDIGLGSAVASVFSRSPAVLAMAATSLDRVSNGRALLGVGASHPGTVEGLHGVAYEQPVRRTHEAMAVVKKLTRGGDAPAEYSGELFDVSGYPPVDCPVPVYNGALGAANRRATGRVADGWIPHLVPFSTYADEFETVAAAAREAGRSPDDVTVRPQVLAAVGSNPEAGRTLVRQFVADYIGRKEAYRAKIGDVYPDATDRVAKAWDRNPDEAVELVTDEMVDDLGVAGRPADARDRLRDLVSHPTVDAPIVFVPKQADADVLERTVEELAPEQL